jgi:hypothetical protein
MLRASSTNRPEHAADPHDTWGSRVRGFKSRRPDSVPDSVENAAEFGYAGSQENRSAYPKARVVALSECGTHAFLAAEGGPLHSR